MKKALRTTTFCIAVLFITIGALIAQAPNSFNYQAVVRDASGNVLQDQSIALRVAILQNSPTGNELYAERHAIQTNAFGLVNLEIGTGTVISGDFSIIDWWTITPYLKIGVDLAGGTNYLDFGTTRISSVPYAFFANQVSYLQLDPVKQTVFIQALPESADDDPIFEIRNKDGLVILGVYNEGVRINVMAEENKGSKSGFAVGSFGRDKKEEVDDIMQLTSEGVNFFIPENKDEKSSRGGFAVGSFSRETKAESSEIMRLTPDSVRFYIPDHTAGKSSRGGFAVGSFSREAKGQYFDLFDISPEWARIYIDDAGAKSSRSGFAVGSFSRETKNESTEILSVTTDSVKISKSLLIPRLTTEERNNLSFTPGDAMIIFNMTENCMQIYKENVWSNIWCFQCSPNFLIQPMDKTICSDEMAEFTVSATGTSLSYQWQESRDNGITWDGISNGGSQPAYEGVFSPTLTLSNIPVSYHGYKYRCIISGSCPPAIISNVATLRVGSSPPVIIQQPENTEMSIECTAFFTAESPGHGVHYQWQKNSDGINWTDISDGGTSPVYSGANSNTLFLFNVPLSYNTYYYRVIAGNQCGENVVSEAAQLTINSTPVISSQPDDRMVLPDMTAVFSITTSGNEYSYKWQRSTDNGITWSDIVDGGAVPSYAGAATAHLTISNVVMELNGNQYRCILNHHCRPETISDIAILTVSPSLTVTDYNGNIYNTVGIGEQIWMGENLKTSHYHDGTPIPLVTDDILWTTLLSPAYCYYDNNPDLYKDVYGALYNWYAVNTGKLCPAGWHVPSKEEWEELRAFVDPQGVGNVNDAGGKLKETGTVHWDPPNTGATDEFGFTALPGGFRSFEIELNETFHHIRIAGLFWTSTKVIDTRFYYSWMMHNTINLSIDPYNHIDGGRFGFSVRCIKDN